jgi:cell wall-associated NlpC family hydrolase
MDTGARLGLHGRTLSQLLLGEPVEVVSESGGWVEVVAPWQPSSENPRGYPGWLPRAHLDEPAAAGDATAVVTHPVTQLVVDGGPVQDLSWGSVLPLVEADGDQVRVALPGGRTGRLPSATVEVRRTGAPVTFDPERLLSGARQLLGLHYLWGGTCGWGVDCSGLVHLGFRVLGIVVPRDAHDQQAAAAPVPTGDARRGDLYFFAHPGQGVHHVGLVTAPEEMLHATEGTDRVEAGPLDAERRKSLYAAGRLPVIRPAARRPFRPG